jgi:hypothetical protein
MVRRNSVGLMLMLTGLGTVDLPGSSLARQSRLLEARSGARSGLGGRMDPGRLRACAGSQPTAFVPSQVAPCERSGSPCAANAALDCQPPVSPAAGRCSPVHPVTTRCIRPPVWDDCEFSCDRGSGDSTSRATRLNGTTLAQPAEP